MPQNEISSKVLTLEFDKERDRHVINVRFLDVITT